MAVGLAILLIALVVLQYRWAMELADAELGRLRANAQARASDFAREFDREITRAFFVFGVDPGSARDGDWNSLVQSYERWRKASPHPRLVKGVYALALGAVGVQTLRLRPSDGTIEFAPWPGDMAAIRERIDQEFTSPESRSSRSFGGKTFDPIDSEALALIVPISEGLTRFEHDGGWRWAGLPLFGFIVVRLDQDYIRQVFLPSLERRYFDAGRRFDYGLRVFRVRTPDEPIYASSGLPADLENAEVWTPFFTVRFDRQNRDLLEHAHPLREGFLRSLFSRRDMNTGRAPQEVSLEGAAVEPHWRVGLWSRAGGLTSVVTAARRKNLAIVLGVLVLLALSLALIITAARRAERMAQRQIEFVAGVTHELRTPLAVIRSAAENLADGLVGDPIHVRTYGALVRSEGRRLTEMVEQVLELAGAEAGRTAPVRKPVPIERLVDEAIESCEGELRAAGVTVNREMREELPPVLGDAGALRRAIRNLIDNAIKYTGDSRTIGVRARTRDGERGPEVELTVEDEGLGIAADDLPRIFEPFYRGQDATSRAIRGSGLGLSLVRRIIESHGGRITVESERARGSAFTVVLPALVADGPLGDQPVNGGPAAG